MNKTTLALALLATAGAARAQTVPLNSPSPSLGGAFGWSVSAVPDVNGDGRGDVAVGAQSEAMPSNVNAGRVHIFSGAGGGLIRTITPPTRQQVGTFGWSVAGTPDLSGDGRGDLLIGGPWEAENSGVLGGRAYLYSAADGKLLRAWVSPYGEDWGSFGWSVAWVPDVTGDGAADVAVGAIGEDEGRGSVHMYSGATGVYLRTLVSPAAMPNGNFGYSIAGVSDLDGDGRGDVAVGAPMENSGGAGAGRVYVFSGATGRLIKAMQSPRAQAGGKFGYAVAAVGDVGWTAKADLVVGAPGESIGTVACGAAYIVSPADGRLVREVRSAGRQGGGLFGTSVARTLDRDGDGRSEVIVGAEGESNRGVPTSGRAYLFSGATGGLLQILTPATPVAGARFGSSVAGIGDTNADGKADAVVGASAEAGAAARAGRAYLFR